MSHQVGQNISWSSFSLCIFHLQYHQSSGSTLWCSFLHTQIFPQQLWTENINVKNCELLSLPMLYLILNAEYFFFELFLPLHCLLCRHLQRLHVLSNCLKLLLNAFQILLGQFRPVNCSPIREVGLSISNMLKLSFSYLSSSKVANLFRGYYYCTYSFDSSSDYCTYYIGGYAMLK